MEHESIEVRGRTTDEAIRSALVQLGVTRDEVDIEILAEGRAGVFGVGSQEARVRVTLLTDAYEDEDEVEEEEVDEEYEDESLPISGEDTELARETLERMLDLLEFPNLVTVKAVEHGAGSTTIALDVAGEDVGLLIGRHGE